MEFSDLKGMFGELKGRMDAALDRLRRTAAPEASDDELAEAIFRYGVSTAESVSMVAGRGVGMDAVRAAVRERGGAVSIAFTGKQQAGHRPFMLEIDLPAQALVD